MKKLISVLLAVLITVSSFSIGLTAYAKDMFFINENGEEVLFELNDNKFTKVNVDDVSETSAVLIWNFEGYNEDKGFEIFTDEASKGNFKIAVDYKTKKAAKKYKYTLKDLKTATTYSVKIRYYQKENGKKYYGRTSKIYEFATIPKKTKLISTKYTKKGKVKIKWKNSKGATGYLIQYSTSKKFKSQYTNSLFFDSNKGTITIGGLAKAKYYFRVFPYRLAGNDEAFLGEATNIKNTKVKSGCSLNQMINYNKTDLSGRKAIKQLTNGGVDIKKYNTTYDRIKAIYNWHAKHYKDFANCLYCNSNFNNCIDELYGKVRANDDFIYIADGKFKNRSGSKSIHKWSVLFFAGKPFIFDPRMQGYTGNYTGNTYFGVPYGSKTANQRYQFENWFCYWR